MPVITGGTLYRNPEEVPLERIDRVQSSSPMIGRDVPEWLFDDLAPFYAVRGHEVTVSVCKLCGNHWEYRKQLLPSSTLPLITRVGVFEHGHCYACEQAVSSSPDVVGLIERVAHFAGRCAAEEVLGRYLAAPAQARRVADALDEAEGQLELTRKALDEK